MPTRAMRPSRPRTSALVTALAIVLAGSLARAADPRLAGYRWPEGWSVEIAATEPLVINPVTMTFGIDGRLYVVEWMPGGGPNDRIRVLTDTDGNGTFDKSDVYMDHLELPAGLLFWDGWTYLTLNHEVVRLKDKDGDGTFEIREVVVSGFGNDNSHHRVSGLSMGPEGWLYMTTGDSDAHARGSDGSTATVLRSGGVFRCRPDGKNLEVVAFGMRNPWGNVAFDDEFHIFHTDNDNEGAVGFTGCRILHVVEGGDYGWRLREGARCCAPDYERATWNGGRPGRLGWIAETGRGAPAGLCVLNSAAFPPSTRNLLVYPDVFRKLVRAYKLRPDGATYAVAEEFPLLASDDPLFRPDDAEVGTDGALYILDWRTDSGGAGQLQGNGNSGRIYRLTWSGTKQEPALPTEPHDRFAWLAEAKDEALLKAVESDDYAERRVTSLELIRRGRKLVERNSELIERTMNGPGIAADLKPAPNERLRDGAGQKGEREPDKELTPYGEAQNASKTLLNLLIVLSDEQEESKKIVDFSTRILESAAMDFGSKEKGRASFHKLAILAAILQPESEKKGLERRLTRLWETIEKQADAHAPRKNKRKREADIDRFDPSSISFDLAMWLALSNAEANQHIRNDALAEYALDLISRFGKPRNASWCSMLIAAGCPQEAKAARAWALALGRFHGLARKGPDEDADPARLLKEYPSDVKLRGNAAGNAAQPAPTVPVPPAPNSANAVPRGAGFAMRLSTDLLARRLIAMAVEHRKADAFLRDGITRGLEHLGPAAIDTLVSALKQGDANEKEAALYALESWRGDDALGTILLEATTTGDLPASDRANLFRALRDMLDRVPPDPIATWLERQRTAAPEARMEAIRLLAAMHQRAFLAAGPVLPVLLQDEDSVVRRAALELAANVRSSDAKTALVALVKNTNRPADERRLGLSALRGYEDKTLASMLAEQLASPQDPGFQAELLRNLAALDRAAAAKAAEQLLESKAQEARQEAIGLLGQRPESALLVVRQYNEGKLPSEDLPRVLEAVRPHATPELQTALQALLKKSLLAAPTGEEARKLREAVARHGNPERGREIYLDSKKGGCAVCHRMEGFGGSVGPDLTRVWETLSFDKKVESILEPSKEIKEGYQTFKVALKDGRTVSGLLLSNTPEAVTLKDAQGREVRIPAAEVEEKGTDKASLMPAGVVGHLSFNELADLLSFLGNRQTQESLKGRKP